MIDQEKCNRFLSRLKWLESEPDNLTSKVIEKMHREATQAEWSYIIDEYRKEVKKWTTMKN